jgi:hypothetical protein
MSSPCQVIAVSGVGEFGKYICDELLASIEFDVDIPWRGISVLLQVSTNYMHTREGIYVKRDLLA